MHRSSLLLASLTLILLAFRGVDREGYTRVIKEKIKFGNENEILYMYKHNGKNYQKYNLGWQ